MTAQQAAALVMFRRVELAEEGFCVIVTGNNAAYFIRDPKVWGIREMREAE